MTGVRGCPPHNGSRYALFIAHARQVVLRGGLFFFAREDFPYLRDLRYLRHLHDSRHFRVSQGHVFVKTMLLRREACIEEQMEKSFLQPPISRISMI